MKIISTIIYKTTIILYKLLPCKRIICSLIKHSHVPSKLFYSDFKFTGKIKVKIDSSRYFFMFHHGGTIENEIYWKGLFTTFEPDVGWIWKQLVPISETIFDIGANTGVYSLVAKALNNKANIYAFEPSVNTYKKLQQNNRLNDYNIHCEQIAISNINGEQVFYDINAPNQTSASLSTDISENFGEFISDVFEYSVKTITLGEYIKQNNISKIDLIKIDIEMHEPEAIEGLGEYLHSFKPIVVIEVLNNVVAQKLNTLINNDFTIFHLKKNQKAELVSEFKTIPYEWNYIFYHNDLDSTIKEHTTLHL